jgi:hypothetical protein
MIHPSNLTAYTYYYAIHTTMFCIVHSLTLIFVLSIKTNKPIKNKKMKKRILLLSIVLVSFTAFSFAADAPHNISKNVISSIKKEFGDVRDIKWQSSKNFVKAEFTVNDKVLYAYFNNNGDLIAVTRFISSSNLPLDLTRSLQKNFNSYWISDLFEILTENGTEYYATLENADQIVVLKSEGISGWQTFQKEKKENAE